MTPRQNDIYVVIVAWWEKFGYSPSIDEIMMLSKDRSRSNVSRIINQLCDIGVLKKTPGRNRSVRPANARFRLYD
jgi:SOS-response transcriptional repressor LexA